jgi:hypothetical protein
MWGRKESSNVKVILPGEMGVVEDGQIGTFAVGSGCRGYLVYDGLKSMAGVAHVDSDYKYPDVQDLAAVYDLIKTLLGMGARDLRVRSTHNADLDQVLGQLGGAWLGYSDLPHPEFIYDTQSGNTVSFMDNKDKVVNYEARKSILKKRSGYRNAPLLWV